MGRWKQAATLIVAARASLSKNVFTRIFEDYKLLAMRRSNTTFMPTKIVFPGGAFSEADHCISWKYLFENVLGKRIEDITNELCLPSTKFPMIKENTQLLVHPDIAFRICAIRETFEEAGILICSSQMGAHCHAPSTDFTNETIMLNNSKALEEWRNKVLEDPFEFVNLCNYYKIVPNIWALMEWNNWLTPKQPFETKESKRYDTMFYICCLDVAQLPPIFPSLHETTEAYWASPGELLNKNKDEADAGSRFAPPQLYEITEISKFKTLQELKKEAYKRTSEKQRKRFLPVFIPCKDGYVLVLPGDCLYPENEGYETENQIQMTICEIVSNSTKPMNRFYYKGTQLLEQDCTKNL